MSININDYYSNEEWELMYSESKKHKTPFLVVNLDIIEKNFLMLREKFPFAKVFYAVKANPAPEAIKMLNGLGTCFDVASRYELDLVLANGGTPDRISYGNTIKKREDIKYFYDKGCRLFVTDSEEDTKNIAKFAPGSDIFFRILLDGSKSADWPLSFKFGSEPEVIKDLMRLSKKLGLNPRGVSFHVGSQQRDINTWKTALSIVASIFNDMKKEGINLNLINMGGGFPANYITKTETMDKYSSQITSYIKEFFGENMPTIILEPGRSLFGNSGILVTEVVLIEQKSKNTKDKWLYIDAGKFNGLIETIDESIHYPLYTDVKGKDSESFIIAGPTCDSLDVIYENFRNPLPENIQIGDRIYWLSTGAYTTSYCSVCFNGFPPIQAYFVSSKKR